LEEVGLTPDHTGFTTLLALCRASSASAAASAAASEGVSTPTKAIMHTKSGAMLDAALSNHFNGIAAPGCRFLFSPQHGHGLDSHRARAKHLVVAFSSLGNGVVRHEFGGSLAKLNNRGDATVDVLFVADPAQSWYQKDDRGYFDGFSQYERRIKAASRPYKHISLIGDSMGGSAALLFSHLATDSVVAFSPQVDLIGDDHVSRDDMTPMIKDMFRRRLFESVGTAIKGGVQMFVHRGVEESDTRHTDKLVSELAGESLKHDNLRVIVHSDCNHHQVAVHLKERGQLLNAVSNILIKTEVNTAPPI